MFYFNSIRFKLLHINFKLQSIYESIQNLIYMYVYFNWNSYRNDTRQIYCISSITSLLLLPQLHSSLYYYRSQPVAIGVPVCLSFVVFKCLSYEHVTLVYTCTVYVIHCNRPYMKLLNAVLTLLYKMIECVIELCEELGLYLSVTANNTAQYRHKWYVHVYI